MAAYEGVLFAGAFFLYFLAASCYLLRLVWKAPVWGRSATILAVLAVSLNAAAAVARTAGAGRAPFANMYEFGMLFVLCLGLLHLFIEWRQKEQSFGAFVMPVAFLFSGFFALYYQEARPLMPALKSNWLMAHVLTAVVAYGFLAVSFALGLMFYWRQGLQGVTTLPSLERLEAMTHQAIVAAMPFLTLLIITGAVWAEYAWGTYWRWDPKETWSLVTWIIYAVYLHGRLSRGWRGRKAVNWALGGFLAVIFTFIGVNLLLSGLHSYALN